MTEVLIGIAVTLVAQLLCFSFWLGKLSQRVNSLCNDMSHIKQEISDLRSNDIYSLGERISYLEGTIKRNSEK